MTWLTLPLIGKYLAGKGLLPKIKVGQGVLTGDNRPLVLNCFWRICGAACLQAPGVQMWNEDVICGKRSDAGLYNAGDSMAVQLLGCLRFSGSLFCLKARLYAVSKLDYFQYVSSKLWACLRAGQQTQRFANRYSTCGPLFTGAHWSFVLPSWVSSLVVSLGLPLSGPGPGRSRQGLRSPRRRLKLGGRLALALISVVSFCKSNRHEVFEFYEVLASHVHSCNFDMVRKETFPYPAVAGVGHAITCCGE